MAAFTAYDAESVRPIEERRREYARLYGVYAQLGITWRAATNAVQDRNRLLDRHPELLAHERRASNAEFEG
jgi:hypothetical protein